MNIIIHTTRKMNDKTGRVEDIITHAMSGGRHVRFPVRTAQEAGARWDDNEGLFMIDDSMPLVVAPIYH